MKKGLTLAALIVVVSLSASAQKKGDRFANLQLTPQQRISVDSVRKLYDGQRASLKGDAAATEEAKTARLKEIKKAQTKAINSILTPEQKEQLKKETKAKAKKD